MIRFITVIFALAVATSAQAMLPLPLHQPDGMITQSSHAARSGTNQGCLRVEDHHQPAQVCGIQ